MVVRHVLPLKWNVRNVLTTGFMSGLISKQLLLSKGDVNINPVVCTYLLPTLIQMGV